ncbi:NDP-hexose 2,3-dehydratase family protein [Streptomyces sp. b94]|uniref:NDP-hexose 2,3-dehydratase family protein n=1 Tax=Streptomyces sp. b94 TaxID=1827634 RepID=UPI001B36569F|nr:NDP-hexose 2,3-dehydratase family protein [Streptomyces sp. b94]MBQ1097257.1 NDP-hexose 2,3-dehydratase family protein [Streptomyces sp. b94]
MADVFPAVAPPLKPPDRQGALRTAARMAESALAVEGVATGSREFRDWYAGRVREDVAEVRRIPLAELSGWRSEPGTGNLVHDSGRFFSVEGLAAEDAGGGLPGWDQPVIRQPDIGVLGLVAREFGGVLHFLMQAKNEPGNHNGVQLSPTVQATRSNYTRVHRGAAVPYLEFFQRPERHRVLADSLQSEQGSWFAGKRNRNIVVEVSEEVEAGEGFRWLTLGQIHRLLAQDDVVNMDARSVLACLPFGGADETAPAPTALLRSCADGAGALHTTGEILSWLAGLRAGGGLSVRRVPLDEVRGWKRTEESVTHEDGRFFRVIGVDVRAAGREVRQWTQPLIEPVAQGVVAFLVTEIGGVVHALVHARTQAGLIDKVELAPTVQCVPSNYAQADRPPPLRFLDEVLGAPPERIRFDSRLSEEGGRFHHAVNRYLIVDWPGDHRIEDETFRWVALHQLAGLLRHGQYLNIEARSLVACLHSLASGTRTAGPGEEVLAR